MNFFSNLFTRKPKQSFACKFLNRRFAGLITVTDTGDGGFNTVLQSDPNIQTVIKLQYDPTGMPLDYVLRQLAEMTGTWLETAAGPQYQAWKPLKSDRRFTERQVVQICREVIERQATANGIDRDATPEEYAIYEATGEQTMNVRYHADQMSPAGIERAMYAGLSDEDVARVKAEMADGQREATK